MAGLLYLSRIGLASILLLISCFNGNSLHVSDFKPFPGTGCKRTVVDIENRICHTFYDRGKLSAFAWPAFMKHYMESVYRGESRKVPYVSGCECPFLIRAACIPIKSQADPHAVYGAAWFAEPVGLPAETCAPLIDHWNRGYAYKSSD